MPSFRRTVTRRRPRQWYAPSKTAVAASLSVTTQPSTAASGVANAGIVVTSTDGAFTGNVTLAKKTGKGTLSGTLTVAAVAGVATFSNVIVTGAGPHVLTASASGYSDVDTSSFTITNSITSAIQTFIDAHGGDSKYPAWMHWSVNVTDVSGKASQVDDVRGLLSGGMVPLVQATAGKRPVISSGLVFTASNSCELLSALDSRIVMNGATGMWALVICKSPGASQPILAISEDPTTIAELPYFVASAGSANYQYQFNVGSTATDVTRDLGTAIGSTVRAVLLCREPTHVGNHAGDYGLKGTVLGRTFKYAVGQTAPSTTGSGMKVGLGQFNATFADVTVLGLAVSTQPFSVSLLQDLATLLQAQYGVSLDNGKRLAPYVAGTSTDRAHNTTHPVGTASGQDGTTSCDYICATTSPTWASRGMDADIFGMNASANGTWVDDQADLFPDRFLLETAIARPGNYVYEIGGVLTQLLDPTYAAAGGDTLLITVLTNFIADLDAAGVGVVLRTIMDYGGLSGGGFVSGFYDQPGDVLNQIGTNALAVNTWMRTTALGLSGVLGVIDFEAQAGNIAKINVGGTKAYANATYFDTSGHPTTAHHALMGAVKRAFYDANPTILFDRAALPVYMNIQRQFRR